MNIKNNFRLGAREIVQGAEAHALYVGDPI